MNATCEHANMTTIDDVVTCKDCEKPEYIDVVEVAKMIRAELKAAFPDTKFSVTTSRYSMGCNVRVSYVDGPPSKQVSAITDFFDGKSFDGMDDSTHYHARVYKGRPVQFPCYSPSVTRHFTGDKYGSDINARFEEVLKTRITGANDYRSMVWQVIGTWDARFETIERAVNRWITEGCQR